MNPKLIHISQHNYFNILNTLLKTIILHGYFNLIRVVLKSICYVLSVVLICTYVLYFIA